MIIIYSFCDHHLVFPWSAFCPSVISIFSFCDQILVFLLYCRAYMQSKDSGFRGICDVHNLNWFETSCTENSSQPETCDKVQYKTVVSNKFLIVFNTNLLCYWLSLLRTVSEIWWGRFVQKQPLPLLKKELLTPHTPQCIFVIFLHWASTHTRELFLLYMHATSERGIF